VIVTEEGIKIEKAGIPPDDAQFLETRKFQTLEVARWFNVPPHKLRDLERATFSNIEQQSIEFVSDSLMPWLVKWEKELWRKLIRPMEQRQQFVKFTVDGLLRGQTVERYQAYAVGRQWGWLSPNDILELEDKNGIGAQGDIYLVPQNMMPADRINDVIDAQIEPAPAAAPAPAPAAPEPDRMRQLADLIAERLRGELPTAADQAALIQHAADASIQALPPPAPPEPVRAVVEEAAARLLGRLDEIDRAHTTHAANGDQTAEAERQARAAADATFADGLTATQEAAAAARAELAETRAAVDAVHAALATAQAELAARLDEIAAGAAKDEPAEAAEREARAAAEATLADSLTATQAAAVTTLAELTETRAAVGVLAAGQAELAAHLEAERAERRVLAGRIA
ncbi:MAG TPA: phage portal protein, partial [Planctomycetota bacterium]|nr:phage portal protein [Planctomycetota bacterium]